MVALPWIAAGAALIGGGVAAYGQYQQGKATDKAAKYNAEIAEINAQMSMQQAAFEAKQLRRQRMILSGRQRAAGAANGLALTGSFADIYSDSAVQGELQALSRRYQGEVEATNYRAQSELYKFEGSSARRAANVQMAATLVSSVGSAASSFSMAGKLKPPGGGSIAPSAPSFEPTYKYGRMVSPGFTPIRTIQ